MSSRNLELALAGAPGVKVLPDLPVSPANLNDVVNVAAIDPDGTVHLGFANPLGATANYLPIAGGTLTGPLILHAAPTADNEAATKKYIDDKTAAAGAGTYLPLSGGTLTGALVLANDPLAPTEAATRNYVDTKVATAGVGTFLPLSGGTLTGVLTLSGDPIANNQAATKKYVDDHTVPAGASLTVADTPPTISNGAMWFNSADVQLYIGYQDPSGGPQWVPATNTPLAFDTFAPLSSPAFTGNPTAPTPTPGDNDTSIATTAFVATTLATGLTAYAPLTSPSFTGNPQAPTVAPATDSTTKLATTAFVQSALGAAGAGVSSWNTRAGAVTLQQADVAAVGALHDVGRSVIQNALFNVQQRGVGPFTTGGYTADRWALSVGSPDAPSFSIVAAADADRAAIGDEAVSWMSQNAFTGNGAAGAYHFLYQRIEGLRWLANKTVVVSFWAKTTAGTPKLGINAAQNFGTGGSPSAQVIALATGNSVTLSTTWTRYTSVIAMPSVAGKTFGTVGDDNTQLELWYSSGATLAARSGNIGVQSGTINLWGVQLEIGSVATPLDYGGTPQQQLAACQRFYQTSDAFLSAYSTAGSLVQLGIPLAVQMHHSPTTTFNPIIASNCSAFAVNAANNRTVVFNTTVTAAAYFQAQTSFTASADL